MNNVMALSAEEGKMQTLTMEEFERRATDYVATVIQNLQANEYTQEEYAAGEALRSDLRKSFHKIISRHYVLIDTARPAP